MTQIIDTPCIGICSTVYGDDVCRGCKRSYDEVIAWNQYSLEQKFTIYSRLNQLAEAILPEYVQISDPELIAHYADYYKVRRRPEQGIYSLLFSLLYFAHEQLNPAEHYGFTVTPAYSTLSLAQLVQVIDERMYSHSL